MSLLSFEFLAFLLGLAVLYYVLPLRVRKWLLLAGSAAFWVLNGIFGALYLLTFSAVLWGGAWLMERLTEKGRGRRILLAGVLLLLFSGMFLLRDGLTSSASPLPLGVIGAMTIATPPGISYFTFQGIGYVLDVYRQKTHAEKNYLKVLLFCGFFPQLGQGPIGTWKDLQPQLDAPHRLEPQTIVEAAFLMAWGFFKKLVIADRIAPFAQEVVTNSAALPGWLVLTAVVAYTLALYADFSGGIDIVRGTARLFGIRLADNFLRPFFACSVSDYWRRWHVSLGAWFRVYVLYPLATSRAGQLLGRSGRKCFGIKVGSSLPGAVSAFIVFVLIGLWHALQWNALLYGVWFGLLSMLAILFEPLFKAWKKKLHVTRTTRWFRCWGMVHTWLAVLTAQCFACTTTPVQAVTLMERIAAHFGSPSFSALQTMSCITVDVAECVVACAALAALLVVDVLCERHKDFLIRVSASRLYIRWPLLMLLLLTVLVLGKYGVGSDVAAFVYAGF